MFTCPVCKNLLIINNKTYTCQNNHSFDLAKEGYVNLLMSQKSSKKRHGDDSLMVNARRNFLNKGYYSSLCEKVVDTVNLHTKSGLVVVDAGCGEGYYSLAVKEKTNCVLFGIDISKQAAAACAKLIKGGKIAVASIFSLPFQDSSTDIVLNMFAPSCASEFSRVLKQNGILIRVFNEKKHLIELKESIYNTAYENEIDSLEVVGFNLIDTFEVDNKLEIKNNEDIMNLFKMTPYYYKTSREDQLKLEKIQKLDLSTHFRIAVYQKK